jgi:hypothetical protein
MRGGRLQVDILEVAEWSSNQIQDVDVARLQLTRHAVLADLMLHVVALAALAARAQGTW